VAGAGVAAARAAAGAAAAGAGSRFVASCAASSPAIISETTTEATMGLYRIMMPRPLSWSRERCAISWGFALLRGQCSARVTLRCTTSTLRSPERALNSPNPQRRIRKIPQTAIGTLTRGLERRVRRRSAARRRRSDLDQTLTDRVANDAGGVRRVELLQDVSPVGLGGLHADPEQLGDFLRGLAGRDQLKHFALTRR